MGDSTTTMRRIFKMVGIPASARQNGNLSKRLFYQARVDRISGPYALICTVCLSFQTFSCLYAPFLSPHEVRCILKVFCHNLMIVGPRSVIAAFINYQVFYSSKPGSTSQYSPNESIHLISSQPIKDTEFTINCQQ
jgi:hypothetical protein